MTICDRIDAAIERARWRYPESKPRRINLDPKDWREFDEAMREDWPSAVHTFSYRDLQIFKARDCRSRLITDRGCAVCIPKSLSPRVRAA